jgi:hypothetical protein
LVTRKSTLLIAFHGVLLVVLGMLTGLPFANAITADAGVEVERAWRVAHTSLVTAGTLYVAVAAITQYLILSRQGAAFVTWSFVLSAYAFAFAFVVGPIVGARGLDPSGPSLNVMIFVLLHVSLLAFLASVTIVLWSLWVALRRSDSLVRCLTRLWS